jgi:hypothetical protein
MTLAEELYLASRKPSSRARPQAVILADGYTYKEDAGIYIPSGTEILSNGTSDSFLILSDDNRAPIDVSKERIENRRRMTNGKMRSYHIADKLSLSLSWSMLPSRSFSKSPEFESVTDDDAYALGKPTTLTTSFTNDDKNVSPIKLSGSRYTEDQQYTTDGGAGGVELLDWYENHPGSFYVLLSYDKYNDFSGASKYTRLGNYTQVVEVMFADFGYSINKRGGTNHDMWDISFTLEEV